MRPTSATRGRINCVRTILTTINTILKQNGLQVSAIVSCKISAENITIEEYVKR